MAQLTPEQQAKQELYRDARFTDKYDDIWQSVGKCVFCDLNEKYVFFEENGVVMTISLYAYIDGHFMILPRRHIRSTKDLTELEWATIRKFTYIAKKIIKDVHGVKGVQFVQKDGAAAQSTVTDHIHFHCVPFDAPDLLTWNYRKLKYTPLENAQLYKQARKKILTADLKFQKKYGNNSTLPVICDVLILDGTKLLFEERADDAKLSPDYITPPGGHVDDLSSTLESELAREIKEEVNLFIEPTALRLISSRLDQVTRVQTSKQLAATYTSVDKSLRNTYLLKDADLSNLKAGDDAKALIWVELKDVANHPRISPSTKEIIEQAAL